MRKIHTWQLQQYTQDNYKNTYKTTNNNTNKTTLNADLIPICCLLALLGAHYILYVSGVRAKRKTNLNE